MNQLTTKGPTIGYPSSTLPLLLWPRQYPRGLGECLFTSWQSVQGLPRLDFRQKQGLDPRMTDLEIFESLPMTDPLTDAKITSLFLYLYANKNLVVPNEWRSTMDAMRSEMQKYVARLHVVDWKLQSVPKSDMYQIVCLGSDWIRFDWLMMAGSSIQPLPFMGN